MEVPSGGYSVIFTEPRGKYPPLTTHSEVNNCFSENSVIIELTNDDFWPIYYCQRSKFWRGIDQTVEGTSSKLIWGITFLETSEQTLRNARKMVYFREEIGNLCQTNWFKQGSIMFFFRNKLNLGKTLNVNFARISKNPPLHKIEFSLFSRNLKFKIKTRRRNSLITRGQKIAEDKSKVSDEIWKHPKSEKKSFRISDTPKQCKYVSELRIPPNRAKMFPNFGYPQTVQT